MPASAKAFWRTMAPTQRRHMRVSSSETSRFGTKSDRLRDVVTFANPETTTNTSETTTADPFTDPLAKQFKTLYNTPGKRIKWGVFKEEIGEVNVSEEESNSLRAAAAMSLTNIDMDERTRRGLVGKAFAGATVLLALGQVVTHQPPSTRAIIALPLFFAVGFLGSEKEGL